MESIIKEKQKEQKYPCLKQAKEIGVVVLFFKKDTGTVVHVPISGSHFKLGDCIYEWDESVFSKFNGEITLKN